MSDASDIAGEMSHEAIHALLRFYEESGLDFPITDEPINRFAAHEEPAADTAKPAANAPPQPAHPNANKNHDHNATAAIEMDPRIRLAEDPRPIINNAPATMPTGEVVEKAFSLAQQAQDLDALRKVVENFEECNLKRSARSTVFEGGKRGAPLMLIGGCPSRDDDVSGSAYSGADGLLLEKMLHAIGLSRHEDAYYGFCVPWSPPGGSAPTPLHLDICAPFIARQIELARPKFVVLMGNVAARQVFQTRQTINQVRGQWTKLPNFGLEAVAINDPAMLRREPRMKRAAWLDLLAIKSKLLDAG